MSGCGGEGVFVLAVTGLSLSGRTRLEAYAWLLSPASHWTGAPRDRGHVIVDPTAQTVPGTWWLLILVLNKYLSESTDEHIGPCD